MAAVRGVVTLNGTPLQDGTVTLESAQTGFGASAALDARGYFSIDQIPVGTYTVAVTPPQLPPPGEHVRKRDAAKGPIRSIPEEYTSSETSGLTATVPARGLEGYQIALKPVARAVPAAPAQPADEQPAKPGVVFKEDIVYGRVGGAALLADIAYPESKAKLPVILSMHGGRWMRGTKRDNGAINVKQWADLGFFAMSIDYRLRDLSPPPACYQDVQCAVRFIHHHAQQYNIDEDRIFLIGQSAGGHMVSLAATRGFGGFPKTGGWEKDRDDFRASICVSGPHDLTTLDWGKLWTPVGVDPAKAREDASPIRHVSAGMKPLLIFHADNDKSVPIANALSMVKVLEEKQAPFEFRHYTTAGHMSVTPEVIEKSLAFIKKHSGKPD
jgi:alpha-L-fucosidase 2